MSNNLTKQLEQVPLFAELGRDDLKAVAKLVGRVLYPAGSEICRQGQLGLTAYFVESGELRVLYIDPQGIEHEVGRLGPGDYFGETSLMLGEPRDATIQVVQDATLLYLNKDKFDQLLDERPSVLDGLRMSPEVEKKRRAKRFKWQDPDEATVVLKRKHYVMLISRLLPPLLVLAVELAGCIYFDLWLHPGWPWALAVILAAPPVIFALYLTIDWRNDQYIVTNRRVVHEERVPLIRESRAEAPLRTIQDVQQLQEGLLAQLFKFGDLIIETAGEHGQVVFRQIPNPAETRYAIFEQIQRVLAGARAEERVAIRDALHCQFGIQSPEEQVAAPETVPAKQGLKPTIPAWLLASLHTILPPARLEQGDTITWRKHWVALIGPIALPTALVIVATVTSYLLCRTSPDWAPILIGYGTAMIFLLPWWLWKFADWQNEIYQVTTTRIIDVEQKPLYVREERREASLGMIQNISLEIPGILGKLLNYGSVTIETAGAEAFTFDYVKDPRGVQADISRRAEAFQRFQRQQEAERRQTELLDWFTVYDQIQHTTASAPPPSHQQEI
jgi:CRP-like cAMP-binding protein